MSRVRSRAKLRSCLSVAALVAVVSGQGPARAQAIPGDFQLVPVPQVDRGWEMLEVRDSTQRQISYPKIEEQ